MQGLAPARVDFFYILVELGFNDVLKITGLICVCLEFSFNDIVQFWPTLLFYYLTCIIILFTLHYCTF